MNVVGKPKYPGEPWLLIGLFLGVLFTAGCGSKPDSSEQGSSVIPLGIQEADVNLETTRPKIGSKETPSTSALELESVRRRNNSFVEGVDLLRANADGNHPMNTNRIGDIHSFVAGRDGESLYDYASSLSKISPYAAMELLAHMVAHSQDPRLKVHSASRFVDLADRFGYADDMELAHGHYAMLKALYGDDGQMQLLSGEDREWLIAVLQKHTVHLALPVSEWRELVGIMRSHAATPVELVYADYFEAMEILWSGRREQYGEARDTLVSIQTNGSYGSYFTREVEVMDWLSMSVDEMAAEADFYAGMRQDFIVSREKTWARNFGLSPEERLHKNNQ